MKETVKIASEFATDVIRLARINLGATRTKYRVKAKWKRLGPKDWQPVSVQRIPFKGRITNTGKLAASHGVNLVRTSEGVVIQFFSTSGYASIVNDGRKPGKYAPVDKIDKWSKSKPVRVRDASGSFIAETTENRSAQNFLINRKIKHFGIEATNYFNEAFEQSWKKYGNQFEEAISNDLTNLIK